MLLLTLPEGVDVSMNTHFKIVELTLKGKNPVTSRSSKLEWGNNIRYYILLDCLNLVSLLVENTPRGKAIGRCRGRGRDKRGR
ncbi:unnamed protein product [Brassica rapa]|uniref:Uncharacterized protein n=1 Tax=Brassica campestris TaxID=3711 RepID=A0A8D9D854_BRACM|nr:unnamed protein product [Brassica rapa]